MTMYVVIFTIWENVGIYVNSGLLANTICLLFFISLSSIPFHSGSSTPLQLAILCMLQ